MRRTKVHGTRTPDLLRPMTTGQVAKIVCTSPKMVNDWVDAGRLQGYKLPGSRDRRVMHSALREFLKVNGLPTDRYEAFVAGGMAAITAEQSET